VAARKPRRWIVAVGIAWTVVLVALGGWAVLHSSVTDREQTTVAQAVPTVNRAVADLASASTVDGQAVVAVGDFTKAGPCKVTLFRSGARYERVVTALVQPGTEDALVRRVAARLPASYKAMITIRAPLTMTADAGFFVGVDGTTEAPGVVQFVVDTGGCRSAGDVPASVTGVATGQDAPVRDVLTRLGAASATSRRYAVPCSGGGEMSTVEAFAAVTPSSPLETVLASIPATKPVITADTLYAYTVDGSQVAVRVVTGGVIITSTVLCGHQ
jgi:hypothetical protein